MTGQSFSSSSLSIIVSLLLFVSVRSKECNQVNLCSCKFDDGSVVDITSLGNTDNTPRFQDVLAKGEGNYYSYNPCSPFNEAKCTNAAACILNSDKTQSFTIGDAPKAAFKYDDSSQNVVVAYSSGTPPASLLFTEVTLVCDESACSPEFTALGNQVEFFFVLAIDPPDQFVKYQSISQVSDTKNKTVDSRDAALELEVAKRPIVVYTMFQDIPWLYIDPVYWDDNRQMTLKTVCACPNGCTASGPKNCKGKGLSAGSILCIALVSITALYIIGGVLIMKFVKKQEGVEVIPNVSFWRRLPVHIKTGVFFTLGKCSPRFKKETYDAI